MPRRGITKDGVNIQDVRISDPIETGAGGYVGTIPFWDAVGLGLVEGWSSVEKFGENSDIDTGTDPEDIWSAGGLYTFSTTADIDSISSGSVTDTQEITIQGLDTNWELVTQTATLNGQTTVTLTTPLIRVFRAWNSNGTKTTGVVHIYINGATVVNGVPSNLSETRLQITVDAQQTEMAIYTVPAGYTGYFLGGYVSMSRAKTTGAAVFTSRIRLFDGVFRVLSRIACNNTGSSSWSYRYPIPQTLPEKTDILLRCDEVGENDIGVSGGFTIGLKEN